MLIRSARSLQTLWHSTPWETREITERTEPQDQGAALPCSSSSNVTRVPLPVFGIAVEVSPLLQGQKRAVRNGDTLYVSDAMWRLMKDATDKELRHLFEHLEFLDVSAFAGELNLLGKPQLLRR